MSGVRLSKKYGLNPSLNVCFWCGEDTGEILLLGSGYKHGEQAPMRGVYSYTPCDNCKKCMNSGITLIEMSDRPQQPEQPPMQEIGMRSYYPTGRWFVVNPDFILRNFDPGVAQDIVKSGKAFIEKEIGDMLAEAQLAS